MDRVDFLTHPHHRLTQNFDWLHKALGVETKVIYGDPETLEKYLASLQVDPPRLLILFQLEFVAAWASCFCPVLAFPMHDFTRHTPDAYLASLRRVEWFCFCRNLHHRLSGLGLSSRYGQYAPDPADYPLVSWKQPPKAFFWERMPEEFDREAAASLLRTIGVDLLEVRTLDDACFSTSKKKSLGSRTGEWPRRENYLENLKRFNIFVAPRRHEGLGMTVLEAMAMGMCVLAEDLPTANEYILPGYNGLLYRGGESVVFPLSNVAPSSLEQFGKNARETVQEIHQEWKKESPAISRLVSKLLAGPREKVTPPPGLLEATANFPSRPEVLWRMASSSAPRKSIWRSQRIKQRTLKRKGLFGKAQWFLENPRAFLADCFKKVSS